LPIPGPSGNIPCSRIAKERDIISFTINMIRQHHTKDGK